MLFQKQRMIGMCLALLMLVAFSVNITDAQQSGTNVNLRKSELSGAVRAYNELSAAAARAFMIHLTDPTNTEALEKSVALSNNFIAEYPTLDRVHAVNYYLGRALVQLGDVETGIATLEKLVEDTQSDRSATTLYVDEIGDRFIWNPFEHGLLELGLAYDKNKQHDKADAVYNRLITHPKFGGWHQAQIARQILITDTASRTGQTPMTHNAWIYKPALNFRMRYGEDRGQVRTLKEYEGQVVLLYYGAPDTPILKQVHDKYKDQKFQIISVNADVSELPIAKPIVEKGDAWIHYYDTHGKVANMYEIRALPAVFLLDSEGSIRKTHLDAASLEKAVDELVKENLAKYNDPRTQAVIAKAVEAHGGLEKLKAVENMVMDASVFEHYPDGSVSEEASAKVYFYRDKSYMEFIADTGERLSRIFDGTTIYEKKPDGTYERMPDEVAKSLTAFYNDWLFSMPIWLLPVLAENEIPIQYVATGHAKDAPAVVLSVQQPSGTPLKIYISSETHYIVQLAFHDGRVNRVTSFEQHKDVDGIQISHSWIEKHQSHTETFLSNVIINADIDPKLFDPNSVEKKGANIPKVKPDNLAENAEPKADDIIAAMVAAHGGIRKLSAVENIVRDYTLFMARPGGPMEKYGSGKAYLYPKKYRSDFFTVKGEKSSMFTDGKTIYYKEGDIFAKLPEDQVKARMARDKDLAFREPIWLLKMLAGYRPPTEYVGVEDVGGDTASVVRLAQPSGIPIKLYISDKTHYLVKIVVEEEEQAVKLYRQFKDVDGIILPHQSTTRRADSRHEMHISNVVINAEIDPALFEPK